MVKSANAEIVAIGTEILLGEITDTNSVYLAQMMRDHGINLYFMTSVGDNAGRIADAIRIALSRAQVVITCGGLGPTVDDVTRQGIADAMSRPLQYHEELYASVAARFAAYRVQITENNRRQAYLPAGAIVVENPVGTAPAFIVEEGEQCVISLPGVPRELKFLMQERVLPYLREKYELGIIKSRVLRAAGIGESTLDALLGAELLEGANPTVGLAAHHGIIDIRITAKAQHETDAVAMLDVVEALVQEKAGGYVFGRDKDELEAVLLNFMREHTLKIAVIEAGISDAIVTKLRSVDPEIGEQLLVQQFVSPGDLAEAYTLDLASGIRSVAEGVAEVGIRDTSLDAVLVIACLPDVDEGEDSAEATCVVVATRHGTKSRVYGFGGMNPLTGTWVSRWAMAYVWRSLQEELHGSVG